VTLPKRFEEPSNFKWGHFTDKGGHTIRYGVAQPVGESKGTIVLVHGFRETTEKYFEVIHDMIDRGFTVWSMDWHGQGGSDRFLPDHPQRMYSEGYDEHVETLHQFATTVVKPGAGPMILMAHSMGAHIGLRYLNEHDGTFDSAVMTSPMCDIFTPGFPRSIVHMLIKGAEMGNMLGDYVPLAGDWGKKDADFTGNKVTSDHARHEVLVEIYKKNPALKMGEATYGWVKHTLQSIEVLKDESYLKAITTPVLMGIAGKDQIVRREAEERAAALMPNCTRRDVPDAKHEIWMERDELRAPWLESVSSFLQARMDQTPKPKDGQNNIHKPPKLG
jgi:lysophospholipase